ncbi:hypothetical protein AJ88_28880 [Mesorhizobium amorphae CCBAU 01583]|nr:hypothetical protein AJ88_28880 [Mesorhizobium amorphae CCBAU 01583]
MAAKLSRPAQFDGGHRAALDASEMAVMGLPIVFAVAAEYIRQPPVSPTWAKPISRRHDLDVQPVEGVLSAG